MYGLFGKCSFEHFSNEVLLGSRAGSGVRWEFPLSLGLRVDLRVEIRRGVLKINEGKGIGPLPSSGLTA